MTATATAERTRLELLQEQETKLVEQVEAKRSRVEEYPEKIRVTREESFFVKPSQRPLAQLNSPLQKLLDAEKKDVAELNGLQQDLSAIRNVIQQENARVREQETSEARAELELLNDQEVAVWKRGSELFASLADVWNELVEIIESEDQFIQANKLEAGALAIEPTPASFKAFLLLLHSAATDADVRAEPHIEQLVDSGIYGRRDENGNDIGGATYDSRVVGTRTIETRRRLDAGDRLFSIVPDLRSVVRALSLSGRVPKFTAE